MFQHNRSLIFFLKLSLEGLPQIWQRQTVFYYVLVEPILEESRCLEKLFLRPQSKIWLR